MSASVVCRSAAHLREACYGVKQFENIWLRTERRTADGKVADGSGGIAYILTPSQA
jgi:hypothetical protein